MKSILLLVVMLCLALGDIIQTSDNTPQNVDSDQYLK